MSLFLTDLIYLPTPDWIDTRLIRKLSPSSIYLPTYLPIYLPTYLPIYLPSYLPKKSSNSLDDRDTDGGSSYSG